MRLAQLRPSVWLAVAIAVVGAAVTLAAAFAGAADAGRAPWVLALGLLTTLLAATIVWLLATRSAWAETRAREMAAALSASERRYRDLSQMASDWFWEQDEQFRFIDFSDSLDSQSGLKPALLIGKTRWELASDVDSAVMAGHRAALAAHQPFRDFEYRVCDPDGQWRWVSVTGRPLFDEGGRFIGYRGTARDISAHRRMEDELRAHRDNLSALVEAQTADLMRAKEEAERASHGKSEFLANMSHELRTPMHAILSFARLGHDKATDAPPEKLRDYFDRIHASGERLLEHVNDLLDLSKFEAGGMTVELRPLDLARLVGTVAHDLEALIEARRLHLQLLAPACGTLVVGDAGRLAQVIRNLLSNALKFSAEGTRVTVEFAPAELAGGRRAQDLGKLPALRMTVADQGVGIPDDELDAVFDKFYQSSKTRTGAGGTGLGLAICREIVLAHRGTILARNRPEGGTAFDVILPRGEI